jgi:hypothetical protein
MGRPFAKASLTRLLTNRFPVHPLEVFNQLLAARIDKKPVQPGLSSTLPFFPLLNGDLAISKSASALPLLSSSGKYFRSVLGERRPICLAI